jgi:DNA polymerase-4
MLFCGRHMAQALSKFGIHTIGELAGTRRDFLEKRLGKAGAMLWDYANGLDTAPVHSFGDTREVKSVGNSVTFRRDLVGEADIHRGISAICESVAARMRRQSVKCWVIQIGIKDPSLKTITRQKTLQAPTHLARELSAAAMELVRSCWNFSAPVRMLAVSGTSLVPEDAPEEQLCLFASAARPQHDREEHLEAALFGIREKYGSHSVTTGSLLNESLGLDSLQRKEEPHK